MLKVNPTALVHEILSKSIEASVQATTIDRVLVRDSRLDICNCMETYGGSFVKSLAMNLRTADRPNLIKTAIAHEELIIKYFPEKWGKSEK